MKAEVQIKPYQKGNEQPASELVKTVYNEFVQTENTEAGNRLFYDWISPKKITDRQQEKNNLWLAWSENKIVGMIEIRDNKNITLLFVDKQYQKRGIAQNLFQTALATCIKRDTKLDTFFVHASLWSVPVYKKLGFCVTNKTQKENGIYYVPMELDVKTATA